MALRIRCEKHNVVYVMPLLPEWEQWVDVPMCPHCRMEWMEEHKDNWDFPEPYEIFEMGTRLAMEDCVTDVTMNVASDEGISGYCDSDPLLVALYKASRWLRVKHLARDVFWRIWFGLRIFLQGEEDW